MQTARGKICSKTMISTFVRNALVLKNFHQVDKNTDSLCFSFNHSTGGQIWRRPIRWVPVHARPVDRERPQRQHQLEGGTWSVRHDSTLLCGKMDSHQRSHLCIGWVPTYNYNIFTTPLKLFKRNGSHPLGQKNKDRCWWKKIRGIGIRGFDYLRTENKEKNPQMKNIK